MVFKNRKTKPPSVRRLAQGHRTGQEKTGREPGPPECPRTQTVQVRSLCGADEQFEGIPASRRCRSDCALCHTLASRTGSALHRWHREPPVCLCAHLTGRGRMPGSQSHDRQEDLWAPAPCTPEMQTPGETVSELSFPNPCDLGLSHAERGKFPASANLSCFRPDLSCADLRWVREGGLTGRNPAVIITGWWEPLAGQMQMVSCETHPPAGKGAATAPGTAHGLHRGRQPQPHCSEPRGRGNALLQEQEEKGR